MDTLPASLARFPNLASLECIDNSKIYHSRPETVTSQASMFLDRKDPVPGPSMRVLLLQTSP